MKSPTPTAGPKRVANSIMKNDLPSITHTPHENLQTALDTPSSVGADDRTSRKIDPATVSIIHEI